MAKQTAAGTEAEKEDQPFDVSKTTDQSRVEETGGIPVGIFTEEERKERREQYEKEGRIPLPPEQRNPVDEGEKLLDQQAASLQRDRDQLKERRAEDAKAQAEAAKEAEKAAKAAHKEGNKSHSSHK